MDEIRKRGENLDFLQSFLDASPNGVMILEPVVGSDDKILDFVWRLANSKSRAMLSRPESDLYGKRFLDELPGADSRALFELALNVMSTGQSLELESALDTEFWFLLSLSKLQDSLVVTLKDYSQQKKLQDADAVKHAELDRFFNLSIDLMTVANTEGYLIKINKAWEYCLGYSMENIQGKRYFDFVHPDDMAATLAETDKLANQEPVLNFINRYRTIDGSYRFIQWRAQPFGRLIYAAGRDITESKLAEQSLSESERQFRALFEQSNDAVFLFGLDGQHRLVNHKASEMLGYSIQELIEMDANTISAEPDESNRIFERLLSGETIPPYERLYCRKNGEVFPVEINVELIRDAQGNALHGQAIVRDISERKKAEQELRERERQFRALFEQSNDAVFIFALDGVNKVVNQRAADLLGYSREELLHLGTEDISAEVPETLAVLERLQAGEIVAPYERLFRHRDGHLIPVEINIALIRDEQGQPLHYQSIARDISERKKGELELRERERQFRALFEQSNDAVFILDFAAQHQLVNRKASDMLGYSIEELQQMGAQDLSAEMQGSTAVLQRLLKGEKIAPYERLFRHKDGRLIPVEINVELVYDESGKAIHIQSVVRDIRERKKIEAALQEKLYEEQLFQEYLKSLQDIVIELTAIKDIDEFYKRAVSLGRERFGFERLGLLLYDAPDAVGTYGTDRSGELIPEHNLRFDPRSLTTILWRALQRKEHFVYDHDAELYSDFESIGRGQNAVAVLWNGEDKLGWLAIDNAVQHREISQAQLEILALYALSLGSLLAQKRVQESLGQSEMLYRSIVTMMGEGLVLQDSNGKIVTANAAAERILGVKSENMAGSTAYDERWKPIHEDGTPFEPENHPSVITLRTGKPMSDVIIGMPKPGGEVIWVAVNTEPLFSANQEKPYAVIITFADISRRIKAQQQALELQLEKERIKVLSSFIQGTSHEFRTPLAIIKSNVYLLKRLDDPDKRADKANMIELQIERILYLLTMLNKMSQLDSDVTMKLQRCEIYSMLEQIILNYASMISAKELVIRLEGESSHIYGSRDFLLDAFSQLILNAIQFSSKAGEIRITSKIVGDKALVIIEDDGLGIDTETLPHIFERFWRLDVAHSTAGFGLGLPLAQAVIEKHGGEIRVESEVGKGSRFEVLLPLYKQE